MVLRQSLFVSLLLVLLVTGGASSVARGQDCHGAIHPLQEGSQSYRVQLNAVTGGYRNRAGSGIYQGLVFGLAFRHPWLELDAALPSYVLDRGDGARFGLGDVVFDARGAVVRSKQGRFTAGIGAATSAPIGNSARGFGMGHFMLMAGIWTKLRVENTTFVLDARYGRALGAPAGTGAQVDHSAHGAAMQMASGSLVMPMNMSELEFSAWTSQRLAEHLAVLSRVFGAVPVDDAMGIARFVASFGVDISFGRWDLLIQGEVPLWGRPFVVRSVVGVGVSF